MIFKRKNFIFTFLLIIISAIAAWYFILAPSLQEKYSGKITRYWFDGKGYGYYQLNNNLEVEYYMPKLDCDLRLNDSMVKEKGDRFIYHYRQTKLIGVYGVAGHKYK